MAISKVFLPSILLIALLGALVFRIPDAVTLNLGNVALTRVVLQQDGSAVDSAKQWLEFGVPSAASFRSLTRLYLAQGQTVQATQFGERAVALKPGDLLSGYWLGQAYWMAGDKDTARGVWRATPGFEAKLQSLMSASGSYWGLNDIQGAEAVLRDALDLDPSYGPAYLLLGYLLIWSPERRADVIWAFEQAVKYLPRQSVDWYWASGNLLRVRGEYVQAIPYLRLVVEREPTVDSWLFLEEALRASGDQAGADVARKESERVRDQSGQ
jgi:tetratricopeptide (TPR) repeat protein